MDARGESSGGSLTRRLGTGVGWLMIGRLGLALSGLASSVALARLMSPREFGMMAAITVVLFLGNALTEGGFVSPIIQRTQVDADLRNAVFSLSAIFGLLLGALAAAASPWVAGFFRIEGLEWPLLAAVVIIPIKAMAAPAIGLLMRDHRYREVTVAALLSNIFAYSIVAILLAALGFGIWALVIPSILAALTELVLVGRAAGPPRKFVWRITDRSFIRDWRASVSSGLLNWGALSSPNVIVGRLFGADGLGLYSRAGSLFSMATQLFSTTVERVMFSGLSGVQDDGVRVTLLFRRMLSVLLPIYVTIGVGLAIHAEPIIRILFGSQWLAAIPVTSVLFLAFSGRASYKISESLALSKGRFNSVAFRQLLYLVLVSVGLLVGSPHGLVGVASGFTAAIWIFYVVSVLQARRLVHLSWASIVFVHVRAAGIAGVGAFADIGAIWSFSRFGWLLSHGAGAIVLVIVLTVTMSLLPDRIIGEDLVWARRRIFSLIKIRTGRPVVGLPVVSVD
jgi:PST family polysaccharide transporter